MKRMLRAAALGCVFQTAGALAQASSFGAVTMGIDERGAAQAVVVVGLSHAEEAIAEALQQCGRAYADCDVPQTSQDCVAVAVGARGAATSIRPTPREAADAALQVCRDAWSLDCTLHEQACANANSY
jgi:hypothetical protein